MKMIIHDLENDFITPEIGKIIFNHCPNKCIGCFNCWIKHPMYCEFKDDLACNGKILSNCDELIIISKCVYGSYSSTVKSILERTIGYVKPYFTMREKDIHHLERKDKLLKFSVYFYGDIGKYDKGLATKLVYMNKVNFNTLNPVIKFFKTPQEIGEI